MNEKRSRIERYADLRRKISAMDVYSFEDAKTASVAQPKPLSSEDAPTALAARHSTDSIKRDTIRLSADELVQDGKQNYQKEGKHYYQLKKAEARSQHLHGISLKGIAWTLISLIIVGLIVLIVLVITGVL